MIHKCRWTVFLLALAASSLLASVMLPEQGLVTRPAITVLAFAALASAFFLHLQIERQLTKQLDVAEKSVETILDGIADPTIIVDNDFRITAMNKAARDALPENSDTNGPVHCYRALHGLEQPCDPSERPCAMVTEQSGKEIKVFVGDDGNSRVVEYRGTPLHDETGKLTGVIEVAHDLNEQEKIALKLERAQEDVETANRARSELISTMSHEVRTPMNAVLGMTDLLRLTNLKRKQKSYIQIIESSGNMLLSLVDNMLDYPTLRSGSLVLREEDLSLTDLLEQVLAIMGFQAYSKGLELIGDIEGDAKQRVTADLQRLRQIMINLVGNAIKYTEHGEIVVRLRVDAETSGRNLLCVEVSDSGIGMSEGTMANLFRPFVRPVDPDDDVHKRGSGLGLTISKQLVELMDGEIGIESKLDQGTKVRFSVPVATMPVADTDKSHRGQVLKTRRMLVVDDNARVSRVICRNLHNWGMQCESERVSNEVPGRLKAAIEDGQPFHAAIIDCDLGDCDGLSLARAIRTDSSLAHLPIILLTSIARSLEVGEISSIGGIRCVNKPILPSELRHNLFRLLEVDDWEGKHVVDDDVKALRVLIAEDNPLNKKILSQMLKSLGHDVDCADDGPAALRASEAKQYDLILMDCQMPGLDGDEVTRRIREGTGQQRQPIIVAVTADNSAEHKSKCLQSGMDDFLAKPIRLQVLKSGLQRWSSLIGGGATEPGAPDTTSDREIKLRLRDRAGSRGVAFVNDYIELFLRDTADRLEVMRTAVEREDQITLGRECHALKGACLEVGVLQLGEYCDELSDACADHRLEELPGGLRRLRDEFDRLQPVFEAERKRLA